MTVFITELEEKLHSLAREKPKSKDHIDALVEYAWEIATTETRRSFELSNEARELSEKLGYAKGIAFSFRNIAYCHMLFSELERALHKAKEALQRFRNLKEQRGEATALDILALVYWRLGNFDLGLQFGFQCLELNEKLSFPRGIAWAYHNIGYIYSSTNDHKAASKYFEKALRIFREIVFPLGETRMLSSLGMIYTKLGNHKKALQYHSESLKVSEKIRFRLGVARALADMGILEQQQARFDQAMNFYQRSLQVCDELDHIETKVFALRHLGRLYAEQGNTELALETLQNALALIQKTKAKPTEHRIHETLSELYEAQEDFEKAFAHRKIYQQLKDEITNDDVTNRMRNLEILFKTERAEKATEIHRLKNIELAETFENLKQTQVQLIHSEKLAALGDLIAGVAHEVNTPIAVINNSAYLTERVLQKIEDVIANSRALEDIKSIGSVYGSFKILRDNTQLAEKAAIRITEVVDNLKKFTQLDQSEYQDFDIHEGIESTLAVLKPQIPAGINLIKNFGVLPEIRCNPRELNQVFMTLLLNACEAIGEVGTIWIETTTENNSIATKIRDDGKGISKDRLAKIFDINIRHKDGKMRMRAGLATCYNIIQKHNGKIEVKSKVRKGTEFRIVLPVKNAKR